jgi:hypothetical protein
VTRTRYEREWDPRPLSLNRGVTFSDPFGLCPNNLRGTDKCDDWNQQQVHGAWDKVKEAQQKGKKYVITAPESAVSVRGLNADQVRGVCKTSDVGCTRGNTIYLNADRDVNNIAPIIEHELQHWWAPDPAQPNDPKGPYGEHCAVRREVLTAPVFNTTHDAYNRPTTFDPTVKCAMGI